MRALAELGAISFEIFMSDLPASLLVHEPADLAACLDAVRDVGRVAGVTPGDDSLYRARRRDWRAARIGIDAAGAFGIAPVAAEALGVAAACLAASLTGRPHPPAPDQLRGEPRRAGGVAPRAA